MLRSESSRNLRARLVAVERRPRPVATTPAQAAGRSPGGRVGLRLTAAWDPQSAGARAGRRASSLRAGALLRARPALLAPSLGDRRRPRPPAHSAELRGNGCGTPEACDPR